MFITLPTDNTPVSCDKAVRALVQCTDIIVESTIDPFVLARKLFSELIISENVYERVRDSACNDTNKQRLETILNDIRNRVKYDAGILTKFVDILRQKLNRNDLANKIMSYITKVCNISYFIFPINPSFLLSFTFRINWNHIRSGKACNKDYIKPAYFIFTLGILNL